VRVLALVRLGPAFLFCGPFLQFGELPSAHPPTHPPMGLKPAQRKQLKLHSLITSGYPWPSDTVRRKRNVPAPSLLELQRERRETTELGYPGRCRRQPRKHTGPVPVHPWQRAWFMARDPGLRGETGLRHWPGLILTPAVPHTWVPPGPGQVFFIVRVFEAWALRLGTWIGRDSGLGTQ
jgi:hypothetical protein